jgi:hypothetical protein
MVGCYFVMPLLVDRRHGTAIARGILEAARMRCSVADGWGLTRLRGFDRSQSYFRGGGRWQAFDLASGDWCDKGEKARSEDLPCCRQRIRAARPDSLRPLA